MELHSQKVLDQPLTLGVSWATIDNNHFTRPLPHRTFGTFVRKFAAIVWMQYLGHTNIVENMVLEIQCNFCSRRSTQKEYKVHFCPMIHVVIYPFVDAVRSMSHVYKVDLKREHWHKRVSNWHQCWTSSYSTQQARIVTICPLVMNPDEMIGFNGDLVLCGLLGWHTRQSSTNLSMAHLVCTQASCWYAEEKIVFDYIHYMNLYVFLKENTWTIHVHQILEPLISPQWWSFWSNMSLLIAVNLTNNVKELFRATDTTRCHPERIVGSFLFCRSNSKYY